MNKSSARDHIAVCEHLGLAFAGDPTFVLLPRFSRLADAGMEAMHLMHYVPAEQQSDRACGRDRASESGPRVRYVEGGGADAA